MSANCHHLANSSHTRSIKEATKAAVVQYYPAIRCRPKITPLCKDRSLPGRSKAGNQKGRSLRKPLRWPQSWERSHLPETAASCDSTLLQNSLLLLSRKPADSTQQPRSFRQHSCTRLATTYLPLSTVSIIFGRKKSVTTTSIFRASCRHCFEPMLHQAAEASIFTSQGEADTSSTRRVLCSLLPKQVSWGNELSTPRVPLILSTRHWSYPLKKWSRYISADSSPQNPSQFVILFKYIIHIDIYTNKTETCKIQIH